MSRRTFVFGTLVPWLGALAVTWLGIGGPTLGVWAITAVIVLTLAEVITLFAYRLRHRVGHRRLSAQDRAQFEVDLGDLGYRLESKRYSGDSIGFEVTRTGEPTLSYRFRERESEADLAGRILAELRTRRTVPPAIKTGHRPDINLDRWTTRGPGPLIETGDDPKITGSDWVHDQRAGSSDEPPPEGR